MNEMSKSPHAPTAAGLPARLHHNAWVVADQKRTREFYEGVLGFPLVQFWIEDTQFEGNQFVLSHAFYGFEDGSALAFFCMADPAIHEKFKSPHTEVFNHIALKVSEATQQVLIDRLTAADYPSFSIEHGYCRSLYVTDPDGLRVEFTLDSPVADEITEKQLRTANDTYERWLAGSRESNNDWRVH